MDDIQERLEHYEAKDKERKEREVEIMQLDLLLFVYARNHDTINEDYSRKYVMRNAMILDYGKTYGTKAQERLKEWMDDAREKFLARVKEFEEEEEEEEPKTKYRPFTMNEFKATFSIYQILTLRRINQPDNIYTMGYLGYRQYDESDSEKNHIYLTNGEFSLKGLFNNFEIYSSEGWQPFGIIEE